MAACQTHQLISDVEWGKNALGLKARPDDSSPLLILDYSVRMFISSHHFLLMCICLCLLGMAMRMRESAVHADYAHIREYADADDNLIHVIHM